MAAKYKKYWEWLADHNVPINAESWGHECWIAATEAAEEKFTSTNSAMVQCLCDTCRAYNCPYSDALLAYKCEYYTAQHQ